MTAPPTTSRWVTLAAITAAADLPSLLVTVIGHPDADAMATLDLPCHGAPKVNIAALKDLTG